MPKNFNDLCDDLKACAVAQRPAKLQAIMARIDSPKPAKKVSAAEQRVIEDLRWEMASNPGNADGQNGVRVKAIRRMQGR